MSDDNWVDVTVAGKYRVERVLGKGGMGVVVGARHLRLDERVAIKILRSTMVDVPGMVSRFMREALAASKIKSEHVARVTDVDTLETGVPFMVMEYLEGTDLSVARKERAPIDPREAAGWVLEACDAIAEAHRLGIVHRDLKPSNLFLARRRDGSSIVKVLDFGISKIEAPGEQDTTKTGQMLGSPKYMSPEQMLNMRDVDGRSDIWSLGAILYELVTGRPPFVAENTAQVCALVLNTDPIPPSSLRPELSSELENVILRCLTKDRDARYADVAELVADLAPLAPETAAALGARGSATPPPARAEGLVAATPTPAAWDAETRHEGPAPRKSRAPLVAGAVALLAIVAGTAAVLSSRREPVPQTASAEVTAPPKAAATEPAPPVITPGSLPDVEPSAEKSAAPAPKSVPAAKKPRPAAPADPFGGRRN